MKLLDYDNLSATATFAKVVLSLEEGFYCYEGEYNLCFFNIFSDIDEQGNPHRRFTRIFIPKAFFHINNGQNFIANLETNCECNLKRMLGEDKEERHGEMVM